MAIKFICSCGKHLKARDEMAARRSVCPQCGEPVGIPSLRPNAPGAPLGPMTPQERRRLARQRVPPPDETVPAVKAPSSAVTPVPERPDRGLDPRPLQPLDPETVRPTQSPKRKPQIRRRPLEEHWYECLPFAFLSLPHLLGFSAALTVLMAIVVLGFPWIVEEKPGWLVLVNVSVPVGLVAFTVLGYMCLFFQCVLGVLAVEDSMQVLRARQALGRALQSMVRWLYCFLAGPMVLLVAAFFYWLYGGDLGVLDWTILAELVIAAIAYWVLAILATTRRDRFLDANPVRVAEVVQCLGWRGLLMAVTLAAVVLAHGVGMVLALQHSHQQPVIGFLWLFGCWVSLLFWATFVLRLLGFWCRRSPWWLRVPLPNPSPSTS